LGEIVNVEVPGAATGLTLKLDEVLEGRPEMLKVTEVVPFIPRVTSRNPLDPRDTPSELGTEIVKSATGGFTFNETVVVCTPLLPLIVRVTVPAGVVPFTLVTTVSVEAAEPFAGGVTEDGLIEQVVNAGQPDTVRPTALLNPLIEVTVTVEVPCWPGLTVIDAGLAESEKSGAVTVTETVVECVPPLPLTVIVKFSAIESVTVKVEVPEPFAGGVTELELSEQVAVGGQPDTVSATALLNPPTEPTVIVEVPCWPVLTVVDAGLAESVKSGALGAQLENLNDPMRVLQLKAPSAFRYSFTYQNVQSSPGSILRAL